MVRTSTSVQAIIQALNAAETNIKLAKSLLSSAPLSAAEQQKSPKDMPGILGVFDGQNMVDAKEGKKYAVNPNYASKSRLVVGDTLKMVKEDGKNFFKQVEKVEREKLEGVLSKKDNQYFAVTSEGKYQLLPEAVDFYGEVAEGAVVEVLVPKSNKKVPFATLNDLKGKESEKAKGEETPAAKKVAKTGTPSKPKPRPKPKTKPKAVPKEEAEETPTAEKTPPATAAPTESVEDDEELR